MSVTTVRIPDVLKARVAKAAKRAGVTSHAFIVEAVAQSTEQAERAADFHAEAVSRLNAFDASRKGVAWSDMKQYIRDLAAGKRVKAPRAKKFG